MINEKCDSCNEPTKRVVGCWDGKGGTSGHMYNCNNSSCELKQEEMKISIQTEQQQAASRAENLKNGVDVEKVDTLRKNNQQTLRGFCLSIGIFPGRYCDYLHEFSPVPKHLIAVYKVFMEEDAWMKLLKKLKP